MNSFALGRKGSRSSQDMLGAVPVGASYLDIGSAPDLGDPVTAAVAEAIRSLWGHVVLVDDSDDDAMLFARAARKSGTLAQVHRASNCAEALSLLDRVTPALIVLDCDLQFESGLDLLRVIRSNRSHRAIPVVMLSGTDSLADIRTAYELGANSFVRKPYGYDEYLDCVQSMLGYWLDKNCATMTPRSYASVM